MSVFSERNNYFKKSILFECVSDALRNRVWNVFQNEIDAESDFTLDTNCLEEIMDFFGLSYDMIYKVKDLKCTLSKFKEWFMNSEWYVIYDFIEAYLGFLSTSKFDDAKENFNQVLESEKAGYRVVGRFIEPITNKNEIDTIEQAAKTPYQSVNEHIQKSLEFYGDRQKPDYENSIKESISAVEAMCCIINGKNETLNKALKRLKENGIHIHSAMENAFISLYGYTSDEKGIRHAGIDFVNAPAEDAKYMLISCSAFVNYLIEKWSKCNA